MNYEPSLFFDGLGLGVLIGLLAGGGLGMLAILVVQRGDDRRGE